MLHRWVTVSYTHLIHFTGARHEVVAHHAHDGAGDHAEVFFERCPALHRTDCHLRFRHPAVDHGAEFRHLHQGFERDGIGGDVFADGREFALRGGVVILHFGNAAEDFGEVEGLDGDAGVLENLLAIAHRIEGRGTSADGADAQGPHAAHYPANTGEPGEVLLERLGIGRFGVQRGERIRDAILREIVAGGHLAAEAVAAVGDAHLGGGIGRGLDEYGDVQSGPAQRVGDGAFVAEIGQRHDDAVDFGGVLLEQVGAEVRFGQRFDGAVAGLFGSYQHGSVAGLFERGDHFGAAALRQMAGKESAVADDNAKRHLAFGHTNCPSGA